MRTPNQLRPFGLACLLVAIFAGFAPVRADVVLQITKSVSRSTARTDGQTFDYTLQYAVVSITEAGEKVKIEDPLDDELELVSITDSPHVASSEFSGGKVKWTMVDPLPAGSTGQVSFRARFKSSTPDGYTAPNSAELKADNGTDVWSNVANVTAIVPPPPPPPPPPDPDPDPDPGPGFADETYLQKDASSKLYLPFDDAYYEIEHGNKGDVGRDIENYVIEDRFPDGIRLHWYRSGRHYGTSQPVDVYYITNTNPSWQAWPGNPRNNTGQDVYVYPSEVGLPAGEYVTGLKWDYGTIPGGGDFHPDANGYSDIDIKTFPIDPATLTPGEYLTNCADLTGTWASDAGQFIRDFVDSGLRELDWFAVGDAEAQSNTYTLTSAISVGPGANVALNQPFSGGAVVDPTGSLSGATSTTSQDLSVQAAAALSLNTQALALTPNQSFGTIEDTATITADASDGINVINIDSVTLESSRILSITGPATAYVVVNITGGITMSSSATLQVSGGLAPERVLFNIAPGATVTLTGSALAFQASMLAPGCAVDLGGSSTFSGTLISGAGTLVRGGSTLATTSHFPNEVPGVISERSCDDTQVRERFADMNFRDWDRTNREPYQPGEQFEIGTRVGSDNYNGYDLVNPNINYLLDEHIEYVGDVWYSGNAWNNLGQPVPTFEQIDDFAGTGRTLLRWHWDGHTIPPIGSDHDIYLYFKVRVKDDAPIWTSLHNEMFGGWQQPQGIGASMVTDTLDYDGDGDSTEKVARTHEYIDTGYDAGGGTASIDSVLWVKGELDSDYTRYPEFAYTTPGGSADYEMRITNTGGTAIKDLTIIDVLPSVGDTGVIDLSPRGSQWEPFLAGEVELPNHVVVYYSTAKNPCRPELGITVAGCEDPQWSSTVPADITSVHSLKFAFGGRWILPGETMTLSWPMRTPAYAPTGGEVAWNSFGYAGKRADNNVLLLPSEPMKVGIAALPPEGGQYGDFIWDDEDRDGFFTAGEVGINGVRVELYRDNGDGIQDPETDTLEDFTVTFFNGEADGYYVFTSLDPGDYYGVVYIPEGMNASEPDEGNSSIKQLLRNRSFENQASGSDPKHWYTDSGNTIHTHSDKAYRGEYRLHVNDRAVETDGVLQEITNRVVPGVDYSIQGYGYMNDEPEALVVEMLVDGVVIDSFETQELPAGDPAWTKFNGVLHADFAEPFGNAHIRIRTSELGNAGSGLNVASNGDVESGFADWQEIGEADIERHTDDPAEGTRYLWVKNRDDDDDTVTLFLNGVVREASYELTMFTKIKDETAKMKVELYINGSRVDSAETAYIPGGFAQPWSQRTVTLHSDKGAPVTSAYLKFFPKGESEDEFKLDGVRVVEAALTGGIEGQDFWLDKLRSDSADELNDSDGVRDVVNSMAVAIFPMTTLDAGESQLSWDQGVYIRSGLPSVWAMAEQGDGKVLLGGIFEASHGEERNNIVRVGPNGELDASFDPGEGTNGMVRAIAPMDGGQILIGGSFTDYDGAGTNGFICVDTTGAVDSLPPQPNAPDIRAIVDDGAGGFYVAGGFSSIGASSAKNVARLDSGLSVDLGFNASGGPDGPVNSVLLLPDGKILVVGDFSSVDGEARGGVARLLGNGQLDPTFEPLGGANGAVRHAVSKRGGKVVVVGDFTEFAGVTCKGSIRLNDDGTVDPDYTNSDLAIESVRQGQ